MQDASQSGLASLPFSVGKIVGGKYRVERRIGAGAAGIVVAAEHLELKEHVALKILNPDLKSNKEALARFSREARAMFTLKSEHVGRVFDVGKLDTGEPYIVMELLTGQTLADFIKDGRPKSSDAWLLIRQITEAVAEAHGADIIHRDLKPENIFVTKKGDALSAKVIDFGVSRARFTQEEHSITHAETLLGTPRYMAPEQFNTSHAASPRSDVWSLGVIFYRMLGGVFPYTPRDVTDLVAQLKTVRPKALHDVQPEVTVVMSAIVMRCLSVRPEDRYEDARELAKVIAAVPIPGALPPRPRSAPIPTVPAPVVDLPATPDPSLVSTPNLNANPSPTLNSTPDLSPTEALPRAPLPSYSDYVTTKRPLPEDEATSQEDAETATALPAEALLQVEDGSSPYDDVNTLLPTRIRTAIMRTPGVPWKAPSSTTPPPMSTPAPSAEPPNATPKTPVRKAVAWSEIEVAIVVGAFITMLVIVVYMIARGRSPQAPTPTSPLAPTVVTSPAAPTATHR